MRFLAVLWFFSLTIGARAQDLSVEGPTPAVVRLGDAARLVIRLFPAPARFESAALPEVLDLELRLSRPRREPAKDGREQLIVEVTLTPKTQGVFRVPGLSFEADGQTRITPAFSLEAKKDTGGANVAAITVQTDRSYAYRGESLGITVQFDYEKDFFKSSALPLSQRRLDLPVHFDQRTDGTSLVPMNITATPFVIAYKDGVASVTDEPLPTVPSRRRISFQLTGDVPEIGPLLVPGLTARFCYATKFADDLLQGRIAVDKNDAFVYTEPLAIEVRDVPTTGRPADFTGAIGQFRLDAALDRASAKVGDTVRLTLLFSGPGNFNRIARIPLAQILGFTVIGFLDQKLATARQFQFDLTVNDAQTLGVPPLSFSHFDPAAGVFRTLKTLPLPLTVTASELTPDSKPIGPNLMPRRDDLVPGQNDIYEIKSASTATPKRRLADLGSRDLYLALLLPWCLGLLLFWGVKHRQKGGAISALLVLGTTAIVAQSSSLDLADAETAYRAGRYVDAYRAFESMTDDPTLAMGEVFYNFGCAAWRLDKKAEALSAFRSSLLYLPNNAEVVFNERLAARSLGVASRIPVTTFSERLGVLPVLSGVGVLGFVGLFLAAGSSRRRRWLGISAMVLAQVILAMVVFEHHRDLPDEATIVSTALIGLRDEPHHDAAIRRTISPGHTAVIIEGTDRFTAIALNGERYWVETSYLRRLRPRIEATGG